MLGVTHNVIKRSTQFGDYRESLYSRKEQHRKMNVIRSHCYEIYTEEINNSQVIMADGIHSLAYGHKNFKKKFNFKK